jgi:hypothetical protein
LSSPTRLAILDVIRTDKTFADLAHEIGVVASTFTHHVAVLEPPALAPSRRWGRGSTCGGGARR